MDACQLDTLKKKQKVAEYLFLSCSGLKINTGLGKLVPKAWEIYRTKFFLTPKEFTLSKMRKAAQSKFEDALRGGDKALFAKAFNSGIGHTLVSVLNSKFCLMQFIIFREHVG